MKTRKVSQLSKIRESQLEPRQTEEKASTLQACTPLEQIGISIKESERTKHKATSFLPSSSNQSSEFLYYSFFFLPPAAAFGLALGFAFVAAAPFFAPALFLIILSFPIEA